MKKTIHIYPENTVIMAPLTEYTDLPFRNSLARFGMQFSFTQMIDAGSIVWAHRTDKKLSERNLKILERGKNEKWLGVQILGNKPEILSEATEILNDYDFDVLDLNMGCPMKKVVSRGCGAAMSEDYDLARKCLDVIVKKSRFSVTAKTRIVDYFDLEKNLEWTKNLESTGIVGLTIHGRLSSAIYSGDVSYEMMRGINENSAIQIIANGGIFSVRDSHRMQEKTGISSFMLARGAIGNPWIFQDFVNHYQNKTTAVASFPNSIELANEMRKVFLETVDFYGESVAVKICRKLILAFLKGRGYSSQLKNRVGFLNNCSEYEVFFQDFSIAIPADNVQYCHEIEDLKK